MDPLERLAVILKRGLAAVAAAAGLGAKIDPEALDPQPRDRRGEPAAFAGPQETAALVQSVWVPGAGA